MKLSRRAIRMQRHHTRVKRAGGLNLVSLMDIFTILVFFLLVSSTEVQDIPSTKSIKLPESVSMEKPREVVSIIIGGDDVIIQGERVTSVTDIIISENDVIDSIKTALEDISKRTIVTSEEDDTEREVMIMGDRDIPYKLLKKIMTTCTEAKYNNISLAVVKKTNIDG